MEKLKHDSSERKLSLLVLAILIIQPALDVFSYFLALSGSNALSTLARFFLLAVVALLGFALSRNKKIYLIFYGIVAGFWLLHMLNCYRIGYTSMVADTTNFLRIMNFPIFTLSFITFFRRGTGAQKFVYLGFAINFAEILLFTALPWVLGMPVYTYEFIQVGILGWFSVPSAQSAVITLVVPMAVYWAYRCGKYPVYLAGVILSVLLLFVTGTKLTFYFIFILAVSFSFLFLVNLKIKCWIYVIPLVLLAGACFVFRAHSPMQDRERQSAYAAGNYDKLVEESLQNSGADEETLTQIKQGFDSESVSEVSLEKIRRSLIGVYTDKEVYGTFLKGLHDRFGVYNVMAAYGYTTEPTILSDSRVRKKIFAQLVWEEKDFVTKLLGFEYSDMLTESAIYDLENDFPAIFYFCGYFGFLLYMLMFAFFAYLILRSFLLEIRAARKERKKNWFLSVLAGIEQFLTMEMGALGITFLMAVIAAQISGNVLRRPNVTVYFAVTAACLYQLTVGKYPFKRRRAGEKKTKKEKA